MSTESLNRTSNVIKNPSQVISERVNVDVLKQRIIDQKKKQKAKKMLYYLLNNDTTALKTRK